MSADSDQAQQLQAQYRQRFADGAPYRQALWQVLCEDFFQRYINPGAHILDLGCGWGEFSNSIKAGKKYAMDLNPDAGQYLADDVQLFSQDCSQNWPLADNSLDVVFTSNFLEHLPNKAAIEATVGHIKRCLKPGGSLICLGPNVRLLPGAYWDFWDHHVMISERSLTELLQLNSFSISEYHPGFLPYTMSDGRNPNLLLVKLYLKIKLAWKIMGQQFLVVAKNVK